MDAFPCPGEKSLSLVRMALPWREIPVPGEGGTAKDTNPLVTLVTGWHCQGGLSEGWSLAQVTFAGDICSPAHPQLGFLSYQGLWQGGKQERFWALVIKSGQ